MAGDLSKIHELVSDLFASPTDSDHAGWEKFSLSESQIAFFHEHGYLANIPVLDADQINRLRTELADLVAPDHDGRALWHEYHSNESDDPNQVLFHALGAWRISPGFHDLLWNPAVLRPASQLLEGAVRFWHDQLFCKPAQHGGVVAWHQDYSYWTRTQPMQHLTCWIGLDASTRDNGCLQYLPGSHHWDLLPITGLAGDMDAIRKVLAPDQCKAFENPVAIEMPAGHATFHHPLLVHGSQANTSNTPRRAVVLNLFRDGVCSDSDEPLLDGIPPIPKGEKIDGPFFPLLHA